MYTVYFYIYLVCALKHAYAHAVKITCLQILTSLLEICQKNRSFICTKPFVSNVVKLCIFEITSYKRIIAEILRSEKIQIKAHTRQGSQTYAVHIAGHEI